MEAKVVAAILATILVVIVFAALIGAAFFSTFPVDINGSIKTVDCIVYSDEQLTQLATAFNTGELEPGEVWEMPLWVKSNSTVTVDITYNTSNWVPAAAENDISIAMVIYAPDSLLEPDEVLPIAIRLTVSATPSIETFSLTMTIVATSLT